MAVNPLEGLRGTPPAIQRTPQTARVARVDGDGIWVVPIGGDLTVPVGPCRGTAALVVGDVCLLVWTQERPWALT